MSDTPLACFKAYDVRGRVPDELNEDLAWAIGMAYAAEIAPQGPVVIGRDIRQTSAGLAAALARGLNDAGVDTIDIGLCGTEMVYYAAARPGMGGGIMVTASHNPIEYNGMKMVRAGSAPISGDTGLRDIERRARLRDFAAASRRGNHREEDVMTEYADKILSLVDVAALKPLRLVVNAGNGCAGPAFDALARRLPFEVERVHHQPDGTFPHGIPNPLLPENQPATADVVRAHKADLGVAWDGDYDRCFLFDEQGQFIDGYYMVGFLAGEMLTRYPGAAIVHDPRLTWNTIDIVLTMGGRPVVCKTGHAFIKERMRKEQAVYGGEMSAHHYFADFAYCDSGMIPWLLVAAVMSRTGKPLSALVGERMRKFPCSGEINRKLADPAAAIARVRAAFEPLASAKEEVDGLSLTFGDAWRFNLRSSQTEPILRLNVEARGDAALMRAKTEELLALLDLGAA